MRETHEIGKPTSHRPPAGTPTDDVNILIVDDDPDFLDLLILEIGRIPNVKTTVASGSAGALEQLATRRFDLILSDWAIENTNASEMLSRADRFGQTEPDPLPVGAKIPVMFMSGSEKVSETHGLHVLKHFEPVSFILKRCGAAMIGVLVAHILERFASPASNLC